MSLELKGTIKEIGKRKVFDSGYKKVEFVLTTNDEEHPQDVKFKVVQNNVDPFINKNKVGASVKVQFNVRGSEYKDKYYVSLEAFKVTPFIIPKPVAPISEIKNIEDFESLFLTLDTAQRKECIKLIEENLK